MRLQPLPCIAKLNSALQLTLHKMLEAGTTRLKGTSTKEPSKGGEEAWPMLSSIQGALSCSHKARGKRSTGKP